MAFCPGSVSSLQQSGIAWGPQQLLGCVTDTPSISFVTQPGAAGSSSELEQELSLLLSVLLLSPESVLSELVSESELVSVSELEPELDSLTVGSLSLSLVSSGSGAATTSFLGAAAGFAATFAATFLTASFLASTF